MAFPLTPSVDATHTIGDTTFIYNGVAWDIYDATPAVDVLTADNVWTGSQRLPLHVPAGVTGDYTLPFDVGQNFRINPTGNTTFVNPDAADLTAWAGQSGIIIFNTTVYTLSFGSVFGFSEGTIPALSGWVALPYLIDHGTSIVMGEPINSISPIV